MSTEPRPELFDDVAGQLERDEPLMPIAWVLERNISREEQRALSHRMALILRGYTAMSPAEQIAFVTRGVLCDRPNASKGAETILEAPQSAESSKPNHDEDHSKQAS